MPFLLQTATPQVQYVGHPPGQQVIMMTPQQIQQQGLQLSLAATPLQNTLPNLTISES